MHPDAPLDRAALPDMPLDDGVGPALPMSEAAADALIEAALQQALPSRRRPRTRAIWWVAAAAIVLLGVPATAALYRYAVAPRPSTPAPKPTPVLPDRAPAEAPPPEAAAEPTEAAPPATESEPPRPARTKRRRTTRRGMRKRPRPAPAASPKTIPPPSAQSLLDEASRLRGARQWRRAAAAYAQVVQIHPSSRAAYVSRISEASLHLEHLDDPKRALGLFEAALAASGPLDAEARWGRARALEKLGRGPEARRALQELLQKHPSTPQARRAQRRLKQTAEP